MIKLSHIPTKSIFLLRMASKNNSIEPMKNIFLFSSNLKRL
jgi:hypothetical protein